MRKGPGGSRRAWACGFGAWSRPGGGPAVGPRALPAVALLPLLGTKLSKAPQTPSWGSLDPSREPQTPHPTLTATPSPPSEQALWALLGQLDPTCLQDTFLWPLLRERVPLPPGHIMGCLGILGAAWHLELDAFEVVTPQGPVTFTNVVATVAPAAPHRLVLACHYDTKILPPGPGQQLFLGATDSAVPCTILLELAASLDRPLWCAKDRRVMLQLLFLDGEEALGLLHVLPQDQPFFCLSPAPGPVEYDHVPFLQRGDIPTSPPSPGAHCPPVPRDAPSLSLHPVWPGQGAGWAAGVLWADVPGDMPSPCVPAGVPVLHLIPTPFPHVWCTLEDTKDNLHPPPPPWRLCARS
uniref:glutaminyl-peptide cyclotransferase n=1 Tax=Aquila chrysaetos chrysaetos TaxID=223781 RepID=A0A663FJ43_AQUCH